MWRTSGPRSAHGSGSASEGGLLRLIEFRAGHLRRIASWHCSSATRQRRAGDHPRRLRRLGHRRRRVRLRLGNQDNTASISAIHHAIELGVNWVDTAAIYGLGRSEEVVDKRWQGCPPRSVRWSSPSAAWSGTRNGRRPSPGGCWPRVDPSRVRGVAGATRVETSTSISSTGRTTPECRSRRAGDHAPTPRGGQGPLVRRLQLRRGAAGALRARGPRRFSAAALLTDQPRGRRRAPPWCAAHGTGVIVYSPMQSGLLTDSFSAERVAAMDADDWRLGSPEFTLRGWSAILRSGTRSAGGSAPRGLGGRCGGGVGAELRRRDRAIVGLARRPRSRAGFPPPTSA